MEEYHLNNKPKETVRGSDPQDVRFFSQKEVCRLLYAQEELRFLMDRGYPVAPVIKLIGDRYQLSARQRLALQRTTCKSESYKLRRAKALPFDSLKEGPIYIDGFNLIITLEVALSGGVILLGLDGTMRDLAGLRGNYKLIDKTDMALELLGNVFKEFDANAVQFYLDAPVSNSGKLKVKILEYGNEWRLPVQVNLVNNPDTLLSHMERVVTTDAMILERCTSYFNFAAYCVNHYIPEAAIVNLGISN